MKTNTYPQFPDEREAGTTDVERAHKVMSRMLKIFDTICKKHDIDYWLDYGTLLGAVRHQGFIPWDCDIDLGILRRDYNLFIEKGILELPADIFFQNGDTDPNMSKYSWLVEGRLRDRYSNYVSAMEESNGSINWHNGLQIDFFVYDWDPVNKHTLSNSFERNLSKSRIHLKIEEVEELETAFFDGYEYYIPKGYHNYLQRCYGDYMQLPPEGERKIPVIDVFLPCNHPESLVWKRNRENIL